MAVKLRRAELFFPAFNHEHPPGESAKPCVLSDERPARGKSRPEESRISVANEIEGILLTDSLLATKVKISSFPQRTKTI